MTDEVSDESRSDEEHRRNISARVPDTAEKIAVHGKEQRRRESRERVDRAAAYPRHHHDDSEAEHDAEQPRLKDADTEGCHPQREQVTVADLQKICVLQAEH